MIALVTGADRGLGLAITKDLLSRGWTVVAGKNLDWPELDQLRADYPSNLHIVSLDVSSDSSVALASIEVDKTVPHLDLVIANAAINRSHDVVSIRQNQNFEDVQREVNVNAIGALRTVHAFLPLLDRGELKRLCFLSSEAGSIGASYRTGWFGYCMSKAALNMAVKNLSNDLIPQGFSFRLYQPGYMKTYMQGVKNEAAHLEPEEGARYALKYFLDDPEPKQLMLHAWDGEDMPW